MTPETYSYTRYLAAKESVDQRSINPRVWEAFVSLMVAIAPGNPIHVLEVGAGVGATFRRILRALPGRDLVYTLLDIETSHLDYFKTNLQEWMRDTGHRPMAQSGGRFEFAGVARSVEVHLLNDDVWCYLRKDDIAESQDVLIAQAFLDLFDLSAILPALHAVLKPDGVFYYPINFDGVTAFLPVIDPDLDRRVEYLYHLSMDTRAANPAGAERSYTGRRLLSMLIDLGMKIVAAGSSDWLVFAGPDRSYPRDEKYFLHHILHFFEQELADHPEIDADAFSLWMQARRGQIERGELIYLAHQLDVLGKKGD